ncbi:MAG: flavodoxin domain-containing protein [Puniceicoccales bacterium]|jgi:sulfite reductase (NADPH) flavoprotein alpha-component|nr:flavodoxin domain-containing protein [Puniceicoccales bacterium]
MSKDIVIYYATVTGNSESIAQRASDNVAAAGWSPKLVNLADIKPADLASNAQVALFVASTWGDGEPPTDAEDFFFALGTETPDLGNLRYAVFGLGDRDYDQFNGFTKNLDARLSKLGAKSFYERGEGDRDFDSDYAKWKPGFLAALATLA